jgi:alpha-tubulin suppressor-like RCC1 family protein
MPKDDINYRFTENGIVYDFYDVFVPAENFRQPALWTWGNGADGRLGNNSSGGSNIPITTFAGGTTWKQVASGGYHTAAIKTDGSLWTWGRNNVGQLGDFSNTNRSTPVTTFAGGTNWKQVTCGGLHTAAIKTDGSLWLWGRGGYGRLGTNNTGNTNTPVTTFAGGNNWKQVSMSNVCRHSAAIKTDGTLWIWGNGNNLGINLFGDANSRNTPVTTFAGGNNWKQVSVGTEITAAVKTDGSLWTWGAGGQGQLGDNTIITRSTPVTTFAGGNDWKSVSCGGNHIAAIKTDGSLWTWGYNNGGQLGTSDTTWRSTPVTTFAGGTNWKQVTCGNRHTGAIKTDGSLWVWGSDDFNALGRNGGGNQNVPVTTFAGGNNWKQVSFGEVYSAAIQYSPPLPIPTDRYFRNVSLLLHGNGANNSTTFTDSSYNNFTLSRVGDVKISTTPSKFGGSSIFFDGTGDYLTLPNSSAFTFPGSFTVEAWVYPTAILNSLDAIFTLRWIGSWNSGGNGLVLCVGGLVWENGSVQSYTGGNIPLNQWTHLAVSRNGISSAATNMRVYKNGSEVFSTISTASLGGNNAPAIGILDTENGVARNLFTGYIDDLRVTKGVARYTTNFTPLNEPFPDVFSE